MHDNYGLLSCITSGSYLFGVVTTYVEPVLYVWMVLDVYPRPDFFFILSRTVHVIFYTILTILICCLFACSNIFVLSLRNSLVEQPLG